MNDVVLTSLLSLGTAAASAFVTYLTTRRKYNAEINSLKTDTDKTEVENYKAMLEFYQRLLDDNSKRLADMIEENNALREAAKLLHEEMTKTQCQQTTPKAAAKAQRKATPKL